jgi:hypothetical protein
MGGWGGDVWVVGLVRLEGGISVSGQVNQISYFFRNRCTGGDQQGVRTGVHGDEEAAGGDEGDGVTHEVQRTHLPCGAV